MNHSFKEQIKNNILSRPSVIRRTPLKYFSVLIPIVNINGEKNFLFQVRSKHITQAGEISFPGGKKEPQDKSLEQTAVRECMEELGITKDKIEILGNIGKFYPFDGICIDSFIGTLEIYSLDELKFNSSEVEKLFLLPFSFFKNTPPTIYEAHTLSRNYYTNKKGKKVVTFPTKELAIPDIYDEEWGHKKHPVYAYDTPYGLLWGITSVIMQEVLEIVDLNN